MRALLAVLLVAGLLVLGGCNGAQEGNTPQAANELRKEMPQPKGAELPEDKDMHVFGREPLNNGGGSTGK